MRNKFLKLKNNFYLRKEKREIILYEIVATPLPILGNVYHLASPAAVFLALCDGEKNNKEIFEILHKVFNIVETDYQNMVKSYIKMGILEELDSPIPRESKYDPVEFVLPKEIVDVNPSNRLSFPLHLAVHLTSTCGCNCAYCYSERPLFSIKDLLPLERWKILLSEFAEKGGALVEFSGGDPLCYPHWDEIFKHCTSQKIKFSISTKTKITHRIAEKLAESGVKVIQLSIDTFNEITAKKLQIPNPEDMIASILNLKKQEIEVTTKSVVTALNAKEIPFLIRELIDLGIKNISVTQYFRSLFWHKDYLFAKKEEINELEEQINLIKKAYPEISIRTNFYTSLPDFDNRPYCGGIKNGLVIFANGKYSICEQIPQNSYYCFGDAKKMSIGDIWNSEIMQKVILPPRELFRKNICYECEEFESCHLGKGRCIRNALICFGSEFAPDPSCPKAPKGKRLW
jgi:MoaA/NifB/PqqE/SkfB family radical SAM enzyme